MSYLLFALFFSVFFFSILHVFKFLLQGKEEYILFFMCMLFCCYMSILSTTYLATGSTLLIGLVKASKELIFFLAVALFLLNKKDLFAYGFHLRFVDWVYLTFIAMSLAYVFVPFGQAAFADKLVSFKNIALVAAAYFLGRNSQLDGVGVKRAVYVIISIGVLAFCFNFLEYNSNVHFQSISGYAKYNEDINEIEPKGNYDLAWTFQTSFGKKRFAAFFSNPLELASSMLLSFSGAFFLFTASRYESNKLIYLLAAACAMMSIYLSFSRSSMVAFFLLLAFISLLKRYYALIGLGILAVILMIFYIGYFAEEELRDFILDTITFRNPSSFGHLVEWLEGIESMIQNPLGIGLGTSGSGASVDDELRVGGENQFIIYGVQLGFLGLAIYLILIFAAISICFRTYKKARTAEEQLIPFMASSVKFAMLMPSMTSNIETYLYIATISWWMVGYSVKLNNQIRRENSRILSST